MLDGRRLHPDTGVVVTMRLRTSLRSAGAVLVVTACAVRLLTFDVTTAALSAATSNGGNSWAAAASFATTPTHYLKTDGTGKRKSTPVLPWSTVAPTVATLPDYDKNRNADPGLTVEKGNTGGNVGESDATKHQTWSLTQPAGGSLLLSGSASLTLWSAMQDFRSNSRGYVWAYLQDCATTTTCTTFDTSSLDLADWSGGSGTWVSRVLDFGPVNRTIPGGNMLRVKIVVDGNAGDTMWFAYDTTAYPSRLDVS